ncbi:MAG: hypothetical protein HC772_20490 [Leptolyngbyaceae cyanobacterium CRU_2_3]|nr:hypothetical protein [Leptolyngbyaceae cyanobacterium CRU_2_3]
MPEIQQSTTQSTDRSSSHPEKRSSSVSSIEELLHNLYEAIEGCLSAIG